LHSLTAEELPGGVRWAEMNARSVSAHYAPVDVATQLSALMEAQPCAWILTSATLAVGDDFSHFKRRSGLAGATTVRFESPFDFPNQALLYLPKGLGEPSAGPCPRCRQTALPLLEASKQLLLFTSHRALREARRKVVPALGESPPYPRIDRGGASRSVAAHVREAAIRCCSARAVSGGVDVKVPLSVVVIDKLPFDAGRSLVEGATRMIKPGGNPFFDEQVPQAVVVEARWAA
jgi:ATP-dependent DNA helicase DinG